MCIVKRVHPSRRAFGGSIVSAWPTLVRWSAKHSLDGHKCATEATYVFAAMLLTSELLSANMVRTCSTSWFSVLSSMLNPGSVTLPRMSSRAMYLVGSSPH